MASPDLDGRLERGRQTRDLILMRAVDIASIEGLEGLSIGRLAIDLDASKSGVFAHFGSKEELQLAAVAAAVEIFTERVTKRVLRTPPGARRVWRVAQTWLDYSKSRTFPGGCFFRAAASEFSGRPGRVREAVADAQRAWIELYERTIDEAKELGDFAGDIDSRQLAFELDALAVMADLRSGLFDDGSPYRAATRGILARLRSVSVHAELLPARP